MNGTTTVLDDETRPVYRVKHHDTEVRRGMRATRG